MAMFPLGSVLLPGEVLPLHVFEDRYRQMVVDLLASDTDDPEFGVTLIERGHEVGGGDQRTMVGTVARIIRIEALEHGGYALVALGARRIRVRAWLPDDPYPLADVDDWPEGEWDHSPDDRIATALARVVETYRRAATAGLSSAPLDDDVRISDDPVLATYHLAALAPLGAADRQRLLSATTPAERLVLLDAALDDVDAVWKFRAT